MQYLDIFTSNICGYHFAKRAKQLCPSLMDLLPKLESVFNNLNIALGDFIPAGGGFDMDIKNLTKDTQSYEVVEHIVNDIDTIITRVISLQRKQETHEKEKQ